MRAFSTFFLRPLAGVRLEEVLDCSCGGWGVRRDDRPVITSGWGFFRGLPDLRGFNGDLEAPETPGRIN